MSLTGWWLALARHLGASSEQVIEASVPYPGAEWGGHRLLRSLAQGGMGVVFAAEELDTGRKVALKFPLLRERGSTYLSARRFLREARLTARVSGCPGLPRWRRTGEVSGLPYFTLDLIDGVSLYEQWADYRPGAFPLDRAVEIVEDVARAVDQLHQRGVVHRDLKPENVLLRKDGRAVVIDLGLARDLDAQEPRHAESRTWLGTPAYISPEQADGGAWLADTRSDVYGLGAILYQLISGFPPHGPGSSRYLLVRACTRSPCQLKSLRWDCHPKLEEICMRALATDKAERFQSAAELARALARFRRTQALACAA